MSALTPVAAPQPDYLCVLHESQPGLLTEAEQGFVHAKPKAKANAFGRPKPAVVKYSAKKEAASKKAALLSLADCVSEEGWAIPAMQ